NQTRGVKTSDPAAIQTQDCVHGQPLWFVRNSTRTTACASCLRVLRQPAVECNYAPVNAVRGIALDVLEFALRLTSLDRGLRRRQLRHRQAEGRARYVVESQAMTELDARRVAAMLAADPNLDALFGLAAAFDPDPHQIADTLGVEFLKGILQVDAAREIVVEELRRVVARQAVGHLREIVGAEGKKVRDFGDLAGFDTGARHFDHGADQI